MSGVRKSINFGGTVIDRDKISPFYYEQIKKEVPKTNCPEIYLNFDYLSTDEFYAAVAGYLDTSEAYSFEGRFTDEVVWSWEFNYSDGRTFTGSSTTQDGYVITNLPKYFGSLSGTVTLTVNGCTYSEETGITLQ